MFGLLAQFTKEFEKGASGGQGTLWSKEARELIFLLCIRYKQGVRSACLIPQPGHGKVNQGKELILNLKIKIKNN